MSIKTKYLATVCISAALLTIGLLVFLFLIRAYLYLLLVSALVIACIAAFIIVIRHDSQVKLKLQEEEINFLNYHDKLTGLYNRDYFENELKKCLVTDQILSVIMGDVNGLKMINDVFGHDEGDRMLRGVAEILLLSCSRNDTVARYGGDEFAVILRDIDERSLNRIMDRIESAFDKYEGSAIKPSISVGSVTRTDLSQDSSELLRIAEEKMNRNRLLADKSTHSAIINSLKQTLAEKDYDTEEHALRLTEMCLEIGRNLGLKNDGLDQLALLSILHDIGKVAIPDKILLKPGRLSEREWVVMKTHSEIGYRIAKASPDLSHIADAILAHHERYDGSGYPQGLKGEEIPVISRIIAVVDSYDAMTHKRPYREALSEENAVEELKKCSGSQFDPQIIDVFLQAAVK